MRDTAEPLTSELDVLRERLGARQNELRQLRARLEAFATEYAQRLGERVELLRALTGSDPLAAMLELPGDPPPSRYARGALTDEPAARADLWSLYRELARRVHPDLATHEGERRLRNRVMSEVNLARERKDLDRAMQLLEQWETSPELIRGETEAEREQRLARAEFQIRKRLNDIAAELVRLRHSNLHQLMDLVYAQRRGGVDLLARAAAELDARIASARAPAVVQLLQPRVAAPIVLVPRVAIPPPRRSRDVAVPLGGAAVAVLAFAALAYASQPARPRASALPVFIPSTVAATASPLASSPLALPYRVLERAVEQLDRRSVATVRIAIDGQATAVSVAATLADAARAELRAQQAVVVLGYARASESGGAFTLGRAYLSADGRGWAGDGLTEDGPDDGGVVGAIVVDLDRSTSPFRLPR